MKRSTTNAKKMLKSKIQNASKKQMILGISFITALILFAFFSLAKLIDYLNKPTVQFYNTIETFYKEFNQTSENSKSIKLLNLLNEDGLEINSDIKVNASNLVGDFAGLDDLINSLEFSSNARINRSTNYQSLKLKMSKESIEKMNIDYLLTNNKTYLKSTNINNNNYIEFDNQEFNIHTLDLTLTSKIAEIFKTELLKIIEDSKFETSNTQIMINNKEFDCKKITYNLTSTTIKELLKNTLTEIINNEELFIYLSNFLKTDNIKDKINSLLNIEEDTTYQISVFINKSNNEGIKFEIKSSDNTSFSYNSITNFSQIETLKNDETQSISLVGSISYIYMLTIKSNSSTLVISSAPNKGSKEGTITKLDNLGNKLFDCNFIYTLADQSSKLSSLSTSLNFTIYDQDNKGTLSLNISSLINSNVEIGELSPKNSITLTEYESTTSTDLKSSILNSIKNINLTNPPTEKLPSSFR